MSIFDEPSKRDRKNILSPTYNVKKKSKKQEQRIAKQIGGKPTPGSGAFDGHKGDVTHDRFLIEAKRTDKQSLSVKKAWLDKIVAEAYQAGKNPALSIQIGERTGCFDTEDWIMMPLSVFNKLIGE